MAVAIRADQLAKRYQVGQTVVAYDTLREHLARAGGALLRRGRNAAEAREFWALEDVSFEVGEGELLGIIGHNGAGKSTLLKVLARITQPTKGYADVYGRLGSLLEVGTGFHPELTGRENVYLNAAILGMTRSEVRRKFDEIVDFAGVEQFLDTPVKRYSSGMSVRLAFSVAAHLEPEILLVDEALSVGDVEFQRKCLGKMESVGRSGRTVIFVSHNMPAITRLCERVLVLQRGRIALDAPADEAVAAYVQSAFGSGSERIWGEADAPGNENARLRAVRVVDDGGGPVGAASVGERVGIELIFDVLRPTQFVPWLELHDAQESHVFSAFNTDSAWMAPTPTGRYSTTAWIPAHLLNEGAFSVSASLRTFGVGSKAVHHADARVAVTFQVYDRGEGDTARGQYGAAFPGGIRPLLEWSTQPLHAETRVVSNAAGARPL
jgi:lipopolysaccharide transport system ATP-binding protein